MGEIVIRRILKEEPRLLLPQLEVEVLQVVLWMGIVNVLRLALITLRGVLLNTLHLLITKVGVLVYQLYIVCLGGKSCQLCGGSCCKLVNSVIDALAEEGDLDPNAEVN